MVVVPARQDTQPGGIGSLESILGLLIRLKIRALDKRMSVNGRSTRCNVQYYIMYVYSYFTVSTVEQAGRIFDDGTTLVLGTGLASLTEED